MSESEIGTCGKCEFYGRHAWFGRIRTDKETNSVAEACPSANPEGKWCPPYRMLMETRQERDDLLEAVGQKRGNKMPGKLTIIMGGQYGSEGKGVIVSHLANEYEHHIRVGSLQAGHSFMYAGRKWKMQVIPCGWKNPNATLWIGRGAMINIDQLVKEINEIREVDPTVTKRLKIDRKVGILSSKHKESEGGTKGDLHFKIGSTGEGVGAARIARAGRGVHGPFYHMCDIEMLMNTMGLEDWHHMQLDGWDFEDLLVDNTPKLLTEAYERGENILIEGSQGSGLSLIHGPQYPYATSVDTNAAQMLADVGLSPFLLDDIIMVARTYPIRVWGNSGPMHKEATWEQLSERLGRKIEEKTTVTKKIRRVSEWDPILFEHSIVLNRPTQIAVTFLDYLGLENEGVDNFGDLSDKAKEFIAMVEDVAKVPVTYACTGWSEEKQDWVVFKMG